MHPRVNSPYVIDFIMPSVNLKNRTYHRALVHPPEKMSAPPDLKDSHVGSYSHTLAARKRQLRIRSIRTCTLLPSLQPHRVKHLIACVSKVRTSSLRTYEHVGLRLSEKKFSSHPRLITSQRRRSLQSSLAQPWGKTYAPYWCYLLLTGTRQKSAPRLTRSRIP